jgi:multiple sugar transport system ATP-binding protein
MAEVVLEGVGKCYANGVQAVEGLDLAVADGEFLVLVGPSGCGKTTTLRLIAGLESLSAGEVRLGGRVVTGEPPNRRDVAMVFQRPALYPHLNVRANLGFGLKLRRGWRFGATDEQRQRVEEVARTPGLEGVLDRRPAELSGGQQQRVALGRALARRPAVFLLDEPLGGLDAPLRLEMRRELHLLHRRLRATMIYVTHDQEEALTLGDRVVVLDRGRAQQADRPAALYERPANRFVAAFLGWPPLSLLDGRLVEEDGRLSLAGGGEELPVPACPADEWRRFAGRDVTVGARPEDVAVGPGAGDGPGRTDVVKLTMEVRLIEARGPDRLLTLRRGGWTVTARLPAAPAVAEGAAVEVGLRLGRAHLFDGPTGRALCHGRTEAGP